MNAPPVDSLDFGAAARLFKRPQPFTLSMLVLFAIIPFYLFLPGMMQGRTFHAPELAIDRMLPLLPEGSLVYGSLFCAALLPVFVVHQQELLHRTVHANTTAFLRCTSRRRSSRRSRAAACIGAWVPWHSPGRRC